MNWVGPKKIYLNLKQKTGVELLECGLSGMKIRLSLQLLG